MSTPSPTRERQSYRHEAYLWRDRADFVQGLAPFVRDGLDAGEAVLAALTPAHAGWLRHDLGSRWSEVHLVDIEQLGRNPARLIPAWQEFTRQWCGPGRPARGIGEPIWPGRRPEEVQEGQLHEALLNLAVDPQLPLWLLCPYDVKRLPPEVIAEAGRSHPALANAEAYHGSPDYRGRAHAQELFSAPLAALDAPSTDLDVTDTGTLDAATRLVTLAAITANLWSTQVVELAGTIRGLLADGLQRGARHLRLRLWDTPDAVVCDVLDSAVVTDLLIGRHTHGRSRSDALWHAHQVCDLVQTRSGDDGTVVRVQLRT